MKVMNAAINVKRKLISKSVAIVYGSLFVYNGREKKLTSSDMFRGSNNNRHTEQFIMR